MKRRMFDQLLQSVKEGGAILRGENKAARRFTVGSPQVKAVRDCDGGLYCERGRSTAARCRYTGRRRPPASRRGSGRRMLLGRGSRLRAPEGVTDVVSGYAGGSLPQVN